LWVALILIFLKSRNAKSDLDRLLIDVCLMASIILATFLESIWMGRRPKEIDTDYLRTKDLPNPSNDQEPKANADISPSFTKGRMTLLESISNVTLRSSNSTFTSVTLGT
jgi:hypothetical protein